MVSTRNIIQNTRETILRAFSFLSSSLCLPVCVIAYVLQGTTRASSNSTHKTLHSFMNKPNVGSFNDKDIYPFKGVSKYLPIGGGEAHPFLLSPKVLHFF